MGLARLPPSHALWQAFHVAWVLSLLILLPQLKPKIQHPPGASRQSPRAHGVPWQCGWRIPFAVNHGCVQMWIPTGFGEGGRGSNSSLASQQDRLEVRNLPRCGSV